MELQYPTEKGYSISSHEFQFKEPEASQQDPSVVIPKPVGFTIAMEPLHGQVCIIMYTNSAIIIMNNLTRLILVFQISQLEIDFWQWDFMNVEEMKVRHEKESIHQELKWKSAWLIPHKLFSGFVSKAANQGMEGILW